jgi:hypothetical protein
MIVRMTFAERNAGQFGYLLLLVLATYIVGSLMPYHGWQGVVIVVVGSVTIYFGLIAAEVRQRVLRAALAGALLSVLLACAAAIADSTSLEGVTALLQMLLFALTALAVLRAVVLDQDIHVRSIAGAISVYVMLGILFAFVYMALDRLQSGRFFGQPVQEGDFLFFSLTTLTTTGYGDLVPAGQPGRMFAALEMLTGQIFVVTLIARLVTSWHPGEWLRRGAGLGRRDS